MVFKNQSGRTPKNGEWRVASLFPSKRDLKIKIMPLKKCKNISINKRINKYKNFNLHVVDHDF